MGGEKKKTGMDGGQPGGKGSELASGRGKAGESGCAVWVSLQLWSAGQGSEEADTTTEHSRWIEVHRHTSRPGTAAHQCCAWS